MKSITVAFFTAAFFSVCVYVGDFYNRMNISENAWLIVTAVVTTVFVVQYIIDNVRKNRTD